MLPAEVLDTRRSIGTPEGVRLELTLAGPPARALAWTVDVFVRTILYTIAAMVLGALGVVGEAFFYLVIFVGEWFYPVIFELAWSGATPGKRALGLQVLQDDGTPVSPAASVLRNLLRFADFLPVAFGFGLASMLLRRDFKRLGDLAAGTVVVYRGQAEDDRRVPEQTPVPLPVPLDEAEQRLLVDFAERLDYWTPQRALELSRILQPLTGATGSAGRERLVAHANWLVGRR